MNNLKLKKFFEGGGVPVIVERSDNTRVAGGRPQVSGVKQVARGAAYILSSPLDALGIVLAQGDESDPRSYNYDPTKRVISGVINPMFLPGGAATKVGTAAKATRAAKTFKELPYVYRISDGAVMEGMSPSYTLGPEFAVGYKKIPIKSKPAKLVSKNKSTKTIKSTKTTSKLPDIFNIETGEYGYSNGFTPEEGWAYLNK